MHRKLAAFAILLTLTLFAQDPSPWVAAAPGFRPIGVTTNGDTFWTFGSNEGIASSADGKSWQRRHSATTNGALLLGLEFLSPKFGFAYGTGGVVLFTTDAGQTWTSQTFGTDTILAGSFSDSNHGIFRTASSIFYVADSQIHPVALPSTVPKDFQYAPAVAALSPDHMTVALSEGWRSRTGFLSTVDGGKTWIFYEPPHITPYDLVASGGQYWFVGTETVGYDKTGNGGLGVPAVLSSSDGQQWQHTTANVHPCHWEGCDACNATGCLVSASMLIRPFSSASTFNRIPPGHLTAAGAANSNTVCTVDGTLYCAVLAPTSDLDKPGDPQPDERILPRLGPEKTSGPLRCISCSLDPIFVDHSVGGRFTVHVAFVIGTDGVPESVSIDKAPSPAIEAKMRAAMLSWLFEPPVKDGAPIKVSSQGNVTINVVRPPK
jgi:hypothetical protein